MIFFNKKKFEFRHEIKKEILEELERSFQIPEYGYQDMREIFIALIDYLGLQPYRQEEIERRIKFRKKKKKK